MTISEVDFKKVGKTPIGKIKVVDVKDKWRKPDGKSAILWVKVEGFDARAFQMWEPKGGKTVSVGDEFDVRSKRLNRAAISMTHSLTMRTRWKCSLRAV